MIVDWSHSPHVVVLISLHCHFFLLVLPFFSFVYNSLTFFVKFWEWKIGAYVRRTDRYLVKYRNEYSNMHQIVVIVFDKLDILCRKFLVRMSTGDVKCSWNIRKSENIRTFEIQNQLLESAGKQFGIRNSLNQKNTFYTWEKHYIFSAQWDKLAER